VAMSHLFNLLITKNCTYWCVGTETALEIFEIPLKGA
jgi:hypothetical protein